MQWVGSWFLALPLAAAVLMGCGETSANVDARREAVGDSGVLHFEVDADAPLSPGTNDLRISIHDADTDAPLTGATVELSAIMPAMAHGAPEAPTIEEMGAGVYLARDVALPMAGRWEVHVHASQADKQDMVTFMYDIR